jgi:acetyltransferase-like isoleucine patch superfamily enzyme
MRNLYNYLRYDWPLFLVLRLTNWLPENMIFIELRGFLASFFFKSCGKRLRIQRNVSISSPRNIVLGNYVTIPYGCWILGGELIEMKDHSGLSPYVCLLASSFEFVENMKGIPVCGTIIIEKRAWVGAHSTVLKDSIIGEDSIITANSLVNRKIPPRTIYGGNPIKKITNRVVLPTSIS